VFHFGFWLHYTNSETDKCYVNKKRKLHKTEEVSCQLTSWSLTWLHDWTHVISRAWVVYWSMEEKAVVLTKTENVSSLCVCGCCIKWSRAPVVPLLGDAVMFSMSGKMEYWLGNIMAVNTITGVPGFTCTSFLNLEQPSASLLSTIR